MTMCAHMPTEYRVGCCYLMVRVNGGYSHISCQAVLIIVSCVHLAAEKLFLCVQLDVNQTEESH